MILTDLCQELKNWFERSKFVGQFEIKNGIITSLNDGDMGLLTDQYFRIIGSVFNDGVHQHPATDLVDETFEGAVWGMGIPKAVLDLAAEIEAWQNKYGSVDSQAMSPYNSESFGGYSYSKSKGGVSDGSVDATTWQGAFRSRLNQWRKI